MANYKNSFFRQDNTNPYIKEYFSTTVTPVLYKGFEIYKHSNIEFHIVKNGVCVGMVGNVESSKQRIDTNNPPLNL